MLIWFLTQFSPFKPSIIILHLRCYKRRGTFAYKVITYLIDIYSKGHRNSIEHVISEQDENIGLSPNWASAPGVSTEAWEGSYNVLSGFSRPTMRMLLYEFGVSKVKAGDINKYNTEGKKFTLIRYGKRSSHVDLLGTPDLHFEGTFHREYNVPARIFLKLIITNGKYLCAV